MGITINASSVENGMEKVNRRLDTAVRKSLEQIGLLIEGDAAEKCPVDTGRLANSITHQVDDKSVSVGTNVEYGKYVEFGTGRYAVNGDGRDTPWAYQNSKGEWVYTQGNRAQPFLVPAAKNNQVKIKKIIENNIGSM